MQMFLRETNVEGDFSWQWVPTENSSLGLEIPQIGMVRSGQFVPASALSGGEKNRLLLAFRVVFSFPIQFSYLTSLMLVWGRNAFETSKPS